LCRLEQVDLSRRHGLAKVMGTVVSIGGATVITLYKGLPLFNLNLNIKSLVTLSSSSLILNWTLGCIFILGHCLSWSGWMVLQVSSLIQLLHEPKHCLCVGILVFGALKIVIFLHQVPVLKIYNSGRDLKMRMHSIGQIKCYSNCHMPTK
jgi:hypothetical protein